MPFDRPTLSQIHADTQADIESRLPGTDPTIRRSFLGVLSTAWSGAMHSLFGFLTFVSQQVFPDSAETEFLDRWSAIWGVARKPAWPASGKVTFTGTNGSVIPAGTVLRRADETEFATQNEVTIAAGTATDDVIAAEPGDAGNTNPASALSLVSPIAGVDATVSIGVDGLAGGSDEETDAALRERLLFRIQNPPHGGAHHDYEGWALDTDTHGIEITRAWVYSKELGLGTVTLRFMMDDTYADGVPDAADVTALQAYIDSARPVTADVTVVAPVAVPLDFEISGLVPGEQAVKDAIAAELKDLIRREAEPASTLLISHIREAISIAAGEHDHELVAPAGDVAHTTGQICTFGEISWI